MPLHITNETAERLTRKLAGIENVSLSRAISLAMSEALERREVRETPLETAERIRARHGIRLDEKARQPLPREAFDAMWQRR
ncbi:type II toxin-antitoxin system VapB family antitoxin [Aureimonas altamirensis]|uniref:type II toxin-antitoxin system VapB family antitoxin n=1 Tax=Aureimonas altamirensis TaxID=370622 RepID=UPI0020374E80|nr:type II toxin-antitoxin system VapB family antitoxin [Aureimonas altamirensis]MCM2502974.1 type II toxin-antitoxin system VapB family antitoxin [Aureimonas altamirensis]